MTGAVDAFDSATVKAMLEVPLLPSVRLASAIDTLGGVAAVIRFCHLVRVSERFATILVICSWLIGTSRRV